MNPVPVQSYMCTDEPENEKGDGNMCALNSAAVGNLKSGEYDPRDKESADDDEGHRQKQEPIEQKTDASFWRERRSNKSRGGLDHPIPVEKKVKEEGDSDQGAGSLVEKESAQNVGIEQQCKGHRHGHVQSQFQVAPSWRGIRDHILQQSG